MSSRSKDSASGLSHDPPTEAWDAFLAASPRGQFQQSSAWARVKAIDGWTAAREYLTPEPPESGGFQLLWKRTRIGRIGYVSKGPVLPAEDPTSVRLAVGRLTAVARTLRLRAIMLQPPDESTIGEADLVAHGFGRNPVPSVIRSTAVIDLAGGRAAVLEGMGKKSRLEIRNAAKQGVTVHRGDRADVPRFFSLMVESCRRQQSRPNPSSAEALGALWDAFAPNVMLGFAVVRGDVVAGLLLLGFGRRLTLWKKGWNSTGTQTYANRMLNAEALGWACDRGYALADFAGMDPDIAASLLAGHSLTPEQARSRDLFNLRLGAQPKLLPPARLLVVNPLLRQIHRTLGTIPAVDRLVLRRLGGG